MSDVMKRIYNACDPSEPATPEYYLDCAEARGSSALADEFRRQIALADDYLCFLFSGHVGCGKSSELKHLKDVLLNPSPPHERYFPVVLNVSEYLDDYDVALTDILLAIVSELAATLREEANIELKDSYFIKRFNEVKQILLGDVTVDKGELALAGSKLTIQRLQKNPDQRQKVREKLHPQLPNMLDAINDIFEQARLEVRKSGVAKDRQPCKDIVLMLDNLEKMERFEGKEQGLASHRELFLERYTQLTRMNAHVVYTVPLRLVRSAEGPEMISRYDGLFVLPMVKVTERGSRACFESGMERLRRLLEKRLDGRTLEDVFAPESVDFLLTYSGGNVRYLMAFVQNACAYATDLPIPMEAARQAIQQTGLTYSRAIPEAHWAKLAQLDASTDQQIPGGDDDFLTMLNNLSVLEYINGDSRGDVITEPWYAVNPIVRELRKFKSAVAELAQVSPS